MLTIREIKHGDPRKATLLLVMLLLTGLLMLTCSSPDSSPKAGTITQPEIKKISEVVIDGNLKMPRDCEVYFEATGMVREVTVKRGDNVKTGTVLARVDDTLQGLTVEEALTGLTIAKNRFEKRICPPYYGPHWEYYNAPGAIDALEAVTSDLDKAIAAIAKGDYQNATKTLSVMDDSILRARGMYSEHYINRAPTYWEIPDPLEVEQETGGSEYIGTYRYGLDEGTFILYSLELKQARLALEKAKEGLKKTILIAPINGVVTDVRFKVGDQVTAVNIAAVAAVSLLDTSAVEMEGMVDELDVPKIKVGDSVVITVEAYPSMQFSGKVVFVSPAPTIRGGVVAYKAVFSLTQASGAELKNGMSATARINVTGR